MTLPLQQVETAAGDERGISSPAQDALSSVAKEEEAAKQQRQKLRGEVSTLSGQVHTSCQQP